MKKLVIGNWKLNPATAIEAVRLAKATDVEGAVLCPPDIFLMQVGETIKKASLGAQDLFWKDAAAVTGEASAVQLKQIGVLYVIVGHSSRREELKETDELVNLKVKAALAAKLKVILCVGEDLDIHKQGEVKTRAFVLEQLKRDLDGVSGGENLIVAYEPVWSISTSNTNLVDTPEEASIMIRYIKDESSKMGFDKVPVLYGGSVDSKRAKDFLSRGIIDGVLVGKASLDIEEFKQIISLA